ncbi:siphovirus Gp157 family protein [Lacticaseibacillus songhuajiangensis]|uniref:siphovirus Gp157 family protein n=1 Tax=Lacticaseibacillus songhuajiangensis TaxID=1296539 RepID=UPI000F7858DB|nr:siphovirus Gp157 family protein [Lacticaseibacillus songhuajiangensis]
MATLYELTDKYQQLLNLTEDGIFDPEMLHDTMDSIDDAIEDKAIGYVQVVKQLEADAAIADAEAKRLQDRKASYLNNAKLLKKVLAGAMKETGNTKFKTPLFTIWVQSSTSVQIEADDPAKLPVDYVTVKTTYTPNKKALAADLKGGKDIKGAKLVYNDSLRVR